MKVISIILFFILTVKVLAQEAINSYGATKLRANNELIHNYCTKLVSDSMNVKWIGTEGGITKYNGTTFTHYKPSADNPEFLNENIETLFVDASNNLWIGTKSGGLSKMNLENEHITNFNHLLKPSNSDIIRVMAITQDSRGIIWIGTWGNGVYGISEEDRGKLVKHIPGGWPILEVISDRNGDLWYGEVDVLKQYLYQEDRVINFDAGGQITDLIEDKKRNRIWIARAQSEKDKITPANLNYYDFKRKTIDSIEVGVRSNYAKYLALDYQGNLFIGTWGNGLFKSNKDLTVFNEVPILKDPIDRDKNLYKTVLDIHIDKNNIIWLSMAYGGVVKLIPSIGFENILEYTKDNLNNNLTQDFNIHALLKINEEYWIGTSENGLYHGKNFSNLKKLPGLPDEKVFSIYKFENLLFIGLDSGIKVYDYQKSEIIMSTKLRKATSFFVDVKRRVWIGTQQSGVFRVELEDFEDPKKYNVFNQENSQIKSNRVSEVIYDSFSGKIWLATYNGVFYFNEDLQKFVHNNVFLNGALPSVIINQMCFDDKGMYLATPNGLVVSREKSELKYKIESIYNKSNYLSSDFISSITSDDIGNIWFTTLSEIVRFNKSQETFSIYNSTDGIETSSFNLRSFYKTITNEIFFGGVDNVTYFNPKTIEGLKTNPEIIVSHIEIDNESIKPQSRTTSTISAEYLKAISLSHKEKSIQISFSLNDFLGDLNAQYRYKLDGFQDQWIHVKGKNNLNFTGLPAGEYNLHIQGSRDGLKWSRIKNIKINRASAPWLTWWAYLIYGFIIFSVLYLFSRMRKRQISLKQNLKIAQIEKEKEAQVTASKLKFFTNISHEFRTPLTLISGPLEELLDEKSLDAEKLSKLEVMKFNTNRLLNLINQLLDFRKAESEQLSLLVAKGNFVRFSREVFLYFRELAKTNKIHYNFMASNDNIECYFDRGKMEIVLCNLLSNAFNNTLTGGEITLSIHKKGNEIMVRIKDSGKGISKKELDKIFDRFYQIKSANSSKIIGSGIGLAFSKTIIELHGGEISVKSELSKGSEFNINLPVNVKYPKTQISNVAINTDLIENYIPNVPHKYSLKGEKSDGTILIVEDNSDISDYLKNIFEENYNVLRAFNGEEGCQIALKEMPDIIISDVMMPKKDGLQLCKELKDHVITSHIPIIILTARTATVYEIEGLKNGADAYVTKPFNPNVIKARIKSILNTRKKIREHYQSQVRFGSNNQIKTEETLEGKFISELISFVEENLRDADFSTEDLREKLFMSQSTLYRKLKSLTGLSPSGFIRSVRLKKAAELILNEDYKLSYIAYEVGFNDTKYFRESFKKQFNCLPSEYKKKVLTQEI